MLLPGIVLTIIFCYVPMYGITLAFKDFSFRKGIFGSPWCDPLFKNFEALFALDKFWIALKNTVVINVLKLAFGFVAPRLIGAYAQRGEKHPLEKNLSDACIYAAFCLVGRRCGSGFFPGGF